MRQMLQICFFLNFSMLALKVVSATYLAWTRDRTLDNKLSTDGYNIKTGSRLHCTRACFKNSSCISFFFAPGQDANCQLQENVITSKAELLSVPGSVYYTTDRVLSAAQITMTTVSAAKKTPVLATTFPPFSCPPDNSIFRTVQLEDSSTFTYKVMMELRNQSESAASCQSLGGFLARVTTKPKIDMLLDLVFNCIGYYAQDYFVDGSNAGAADPFLNDAWVMSNGDLVPMTTDFWGINKPDNPTIEHCLCMSLVSAYKWDDCRCDIKFCYICEM